jgi:hypothetical protein
MCVESHHHIAGRAHGPSVGAKPQRRTRGDDDRPHSQCLIVSIYHDEVLPLWSVPWNRELGATVGHRSGDLTTIRCHET